MNDTPDPRPVGETDPFRYSENRRIDSNPLTMQCSKLCHLIEEFPASPQQTACIEEANRLLNGLLNQHLETQQLRAAAGEVVGTGTVTGRSWEGGPVPRFAQVSLTVGDASRLPLGTSVSLVLRRDPEGV